MERETLSFGDKKPWPSLQIVLETPNPRTLNPINPTPKLVKTANCGRALILIRPLLATILLIGVCEGGRGQIPSILSRCGLIRKDEFFGYKGRKSEGKGLGEIASGLWPWLWWWWDYNEQEVPRVLVVVSYFTPVLSFERGKSPCLRRRKYPGLCSNKSPLQRYINHFLESFSFNLAVFGHGFGGKWRNSPFFIYHLSRGTCVSNYSVQKSYCGLYVFFDMETELVACVEKKLVAGVVNSPLTILRKDEQSHNVEKMTEGAPASNEVQVTLFTLRTLKHIAALVPFLLGTYQLRLSCVSVVGELEYRKEPQLVESLDSPQLTTRKGEPNPEGHNCPDEGGKADPKGKFGPNGGELNVFNKSLNGRKRPTFIIDRVKSKLSKLRIGFSDLWVVAHCLLVQFGRLWLLYKTPYDAIKGAINLVRLKAILHFMEGKEALLESKDELEWECLRFSGEGSCMIYLRAVKTILVFGCIPGVSASSIGAPVVSPLVMRQSRLSMEVRRYRLELQIGLNSPGQTGDKLPLLKGVDYSSFKFTRHILGLWYGHLSRLHLCLERKELVVWPVLIQNQLSSSWLERPTDNSSWFINYAWNQPRNLFANEYQYSPNRGPNSLKVSKQSSFGTSKHPMCELCRYGICFDYKQERMKMKGYPFAGHIVLQAWGSHFPKLVLHPWWLEKDN